MEKQIINMNPHKQEWEYQYVPRIKTISGDSNINEIINNAAEDGWIVDKFIQIDQSPESKYTPIFISILFKRKIQ